MPQLSKHYAGWNHWYHITATAYGQWLRGDPRGWRERHHRLHVAGGYKNSPPPSGYNTAIFELSQYLLKHDAQFFLPEDRQFIGEIFLETFEFQKVTARMLAVGGEHVHGLVNYPEDNPELLLGRSKQFVWTKFHEGLPKPWPKLWAKRPYCKPIRDEKHYAEALSYIADHRKDGAWVWEKALAK